MTVDFVAEYLDEKIKENENYIVCTFFELRIKHNLHEDEVNEFLKLARTRLENMDYLVYFTGAKYTYNNENLVVPDNDYMVAIKNCKK